MAISDRSRLAHPARLSSYEAQMRIYLKPLENAVRLLAQLQVLQLCFAYPLLDNAFKPKWRIYQQPAKEQSWPSSQSTAYSAS